MCFTVLYSKCTQFLKGHTAMCLLFRESSILENLLYYSIYYFIYNTSIANKTCSNEGNMLVQHHPKLFDAALASFEHHFERCWLEFKLA